MVDVRVHAGKNRLYVIASGRLTLAECEATALAVMRELERVRPGFSIVADVTALEWVDEVGLARIGQVMHVAKARGLSRVVRVVGCALQAVVQLERVSRTVGYDAHLAFSHEEVERLLSGDQSEQEDLLSGQNGA